MRKALIVCFTFPPFSGIGGRRWAKFAKYLHRQGVDLAIVAADKRTNSNSEWIHDISEYASNISYFKPPYPKVLMSIPRSIAQKILYRYHLLKRKKSINYFDHSNGFGTKISPFIIKKINEGYNNIIVSVGPFHMAYELIEIKRLKPEVNLIVDFRDPWSNNKTSFGYTSISNEALKIEEKMELKVLEIYDYILSVSPEMIEYFKSRTERENRYIHVPNGFDWEDLYGLDTQLNAPITNKIELCFCGTLYNKTEDLFLEFCQALNHLKYIDNETYSRISIDFYGDVPDWFDKYTADIDCIRYMNKLDLSGSFRKLKSANYVLLFLTDDLKYSRSTKFYEALAVRKPILLFTDKGPTSQFIEENRLGIPIFKNQVKKDFVDFFQNKVKNFKFNDSFDINDFSVEIISNKINSIIK